KRHELGSYLDEQDNLEQYDEDLKNNSEIVSGLKYFGRGMVNSVSLMVKSDAALETGLGEAMGSLLVVGPISKGLGTIGKAVTKSGVVSNSGRLAAIGNAMRMPAVIGGLEAGGAYTQVVNDVMSRSFEDLYEKSPEYR